MKGIKSIIKKIKKGDFMDIQKILYLATKGASLVDYTLFNKDKSDPEKSEFLTKLAQALNRAEWFNIDDFSHLGERPIHRPFTQVPIADKETQNDEISRLTKIFNTQELEQLAQIIKELKSYGVLPIKELMDDQDIANNHKSFMKSAFFRPFFSKK